jgi:hypothetical protein
MKEKKVEFLKVVDELIYRMREKPPEEIKVFNEPTYIPGYTRYTRINGANRLLSGLIGYLGYMKSGLNKGAGLESVKILTKEKVTYDIIFLDTVELKTTTKVLRDFLNILSDLQDVEEYNDVVDELSYYLKKVGPNGWIDKLFSRTAEMSLAYDLFFPPP